MERNENFDRLKMRLDQANAEIEESDQEIVALRRELNMMRGGDGPHEDGASGDTGDGNDGNDGGQNKHGLDHLSAKDCLDQLIQEMASVAQRLADPEGTSVSASGTTGATGSGSIHMEVGGGLAQVSVNLAQLPFLSSALDPVIRLGRSVAT